MTEEELKTILSPEGEPSLIMGDKMKDIAFWPLSIQTTETHYELNGIWYSNVLKGFLSGNGVNPIRETIKIKREDLVKWKKRKRD